MELPLFKGEIDQRIKESWKPEVTPTTITNKIRQEPTNDEMSVAEQEGERPIKSVQN